MAYSANKIWGSYRQADHDNKQPDHSGPTQCHNAPRFIWNMGGKLPDSPCSFRLVGCAESQS